MPNCVMCGRSPAELLNLFVKHHKYLVTREHLVKLDLVQFNDNACFSHGFTQLANIILRLLRFYLAC